MLNDLVIKIPIHPGVKPDTPLDPKELANHLRRMADEFDAWNWEDLYAGLIQGETRQVVGRRLNGTYVTSGSVSIEPALLIDSKE